MKFRGSLQVITITFVNKPEEHVSQKTPDKQVDKHLPEFHGMFLSNGNHVAHHWDKKEIRW
jgi:hypothetical protein